MHSEIGTSAIECSLEKKKGTTEQNSTMTERKPNVCKRLRDDTCVATRAYTRVAAASYLKGFHCALVRFSPALLHRAETRSNTFLRGETVCSLCYCATLIIARGVNKYMHMRTHFDVTFKWDAELILLGTK